MLSVKVTEVDALAVLESTFQPYGLRKVILQVMNLLILESLFYINNKPGESMRLPRLGI